MAGIDLLFSSASSSGNISAPHELRRERHGCERSTCRKGHSPSALRPDAGETATPFGPEGPAPALRRVLRYVLRDSQRLHRSAGPVHVAGVMVAASRNAAARGLPLGRRV